MKIGPFPVHLIDEDQAGQIVPVGRVPDLFGAHLDAVHRVHHQHGAVGHMEGGPGIRQEIVIPGGVGHIDRVLLPLIVVKGAGDGDLTFNFLRLVIQDGTAVVDFSQPGGGPRPKEEGLGQRGLAAAPMADQDEVADQCGFAGHQTLPSLEVASPVPGFGENSVWDRSNFLKLTGLSINLNRFSAPFLTSFPLKGRMGGKRAPRRINGPKKLTGEYPLDILFCCRDVAQTGSAPEWGSGGRRFKSSRPDQPSFDSLKLPVLMLCVYSD